MIALNGPTSGAGYEAAYNTWYDEVHSADLLTVNGTISVRRFKLDAQNRVDIRARQGNHEEYLAGTPLYSAPPSNGLNIMGNI